MSGRDRVERGRRRELRGAGPGYDGRADEHVGECAGVEQADDVANAQREVIQDVQQLAADHDPGAEELGGLTLALPVFGEIAILAIAFVNSYLEGSTGQSLGKKAVGIYVIKRDTGEFLGGWVGIGRQLLHILDYLPLCIGYIIGLFNTRTFADMLVGSTVVARPRAPQLPPPPPLYPVPPAQGAFPQPQTPFPPTS